MISTPITPTPSSVMTESIRTLHLWAFTRMAAGCTRAGRTARLESGTSGVVHGLERMAAWGEGSQGIALGGYSMNRPIKGALSGCLREEGKQGGHQRASPAFRLEAGPSFPLLGSHRHLCARAKFHKLLRWKQLFLAGNGGFWWDTGNPDSPQVPEPAMPAYLPGECTH